VLGFVLDRDLRALRPLRGIAGAATAGDPVQLDLPLAEAWMSPQQAYALAVNSENGHVVLIDLTAEPVKSTALEGAFARPYPVAISPGGGVAALADMDRRRVQIIKGLPRAHWAAGELEIAPEITEIEALAVSDDGTALLIATRGAVYVAGRQLLVDRGEVEERMRGFRSRGAMSVERKQRFRRLIEARRASAVTFLPNTHDVLFSDAEENRIVLVRDVMATAESFTLASGADGISGPVAVQLSIDGRRLFVANSGAASVSVIEIETGAVTNLACPAAPAGLYPLRSASVFRLNEPAGAPLFVLDGGGDRPRILFVPPPMN